MHEKSRNAWAFFMNMWVCLKIGILIDNNFSREQFLFFPHLPGEGC